MNLFSCKSGSCPLPPAGFFLWVPQTLVFIQVFDYHRKITENRVIRQLNGSVTPTAFGNIPLHFKQLSRDA
jgi:hypothetical protein